MVKVPSSSRPFSLTINFPLCLKTLPEEECLTTSLIFGGTCTGVTVSYCGNSREHVSSAETGDGERWEEGWRSLPTDWDLEGGHIGYQGLS